MRRAGLVILVLAALSSCDPRAFDDVADSAWVQIAGRDDTQTGGDFGLDVIAMPMDASESGARFIVTAGGSPPGLAQITFNAKGEKTEQLGANGELNGKGTLEPLSDKSPITALAPWGPTQFLTGTGSSSNTTPRVIRYDKGLKNGTSLVTNAMSGTGDALAVGNLGVGVAGTPDVVAVGTLSLAILADGDNSKPAVICSLKPSNAATAPVVEKQVVAVAAINPAAGHDQIVVATQPLNDSDPGVPAHILILEASQVVNGQPCEQSGTYKFDVPRDGGKNNNEGPVAVAAGNLDSNPALEIVTGTIGKEGGTGKVRIYFNVTMGGAAPSMMELPLGKSPIDEEAEGSSVRGTRLIIADIDDDHASNELVVNDPAASPNDISAGGVVRVYRLGGTCDAANMRGPACLVTTLFDPDPSKNEYFGRSMTVAQFKSPKATGPGNVLTVGLKDAIWVYFRLNSKTPDPRDR